MHKISTIFAWSQVDRRSGFDCEILLIGNITMMSFSVTHDQENIAGKEIHNE